MLPLKVRPELLVVFALGLGCGRTTRNANASNGGAPSGGVAGERQDASTTTPSGGSAGARQDASTTTPSGGSAGGPAPICPAISSAGTANASDAGAGLAYDCMHGGPACTDGYCWMDDHGCGHCAPNAHEGAHCVYDGCSQNLYISPCCAPGLRCWPSDGSTTCQVPEVGRLGDSCGVGVRICGTSLFCSEAGVCDASSTRASGEPCGVESDAQPSKAMCRSGLFCNELNRCETPRGASIACATSSQCQSDLYCDIAGTTQCTIPGTGTITNSCCRPKLALGNACKGDDQCQSGMCTPKNGRTLCSSQRWVRAALGQWCPDPNYGTQYGVLEVCDAGLYCGKNTCLKRIVQGDTCDGLASGACADGTSCDRNSGKCSKPHCVGRGDACDTEFPCPADLVCSGRCVEPLGKPCAVDGDCELQATCRDGTCAPTCPW